ncbi:hypothetical protein ARTHRO8AJ_40162 [Arthrobacter sp. 8AJ]|nr:hypothetical protein ARTHRO8AJ_40162 [Arthrobacter sp. 8AJ]
MAFGIMTAAAGTSNFDEQGLSLVS